jgi:hypothetical protein
MKVQIMSPAADRVDFQVPPASRLASLEGKTIGLYHNMTGGADFAVERVAEHLSRRYPDVKFERYGGDLRPGRPEYFPVLLAAIDCLAQPQMNHRDMQVSGHTEALLILVNGPIAKKTGINYGTSAMGPGVINRANTAIGRALRLCLINIGYCH